MSDIHIGENCARVEGTWYWKISAYINVLLYDVLEISAYIYVLLYDEDLCKCTCRR